MDDRSNHGFLCRPRWPLIPVYSLTQWSFVQWGSLFISPLQSTTAMRLKGTKHLAMQLYLCEAKSNDHGYRFRNGATLWGSNKSTRITRISGFGMCSLPPEQYVRHLIGSFIAYAATPRAPLKSTSPGAIVVGLCGSLNRRPGIRKLLSRSRVKTRSETCRRDARTTGARAIDKPLAAVVRKIGASHEHE